MKMEETRIPYELEGVNKTLYEWVLKSQEMRHILGNEPDKDIFLKIFGKDSEQREVASLTLYQDLWGKYPDFGPNMLDDLVAHFEHDRKFYDNYRDHSTHVIKCFLLGVYLYEKSPVLCKIMAADEFRKTWTLSALYHDIGYLFENEHAAPGKDAWLQIKENINEIMAAPLSKISIFRQDVTESQERQLIDRHRIYTKNFRNISEFEDSKLFTRLREYGIISGMNNGADNNAIQEYYFYGRSNKTVDGRDGYKDHGIASALIFQKVWENFKQYIDDIYNTHAVDELGETVKSKVSDIRKQMLNDEEVISYALGAVALHNISCDLWDKSDILERGISLDKFKIILNKQLFCAFLLRLCDEIQMWDRQRFRKPDEMDEFVNGKDVDITAKKGKIYIWFTKDDQYTNPETNPESEFGKLFNKLSKYLCKDDLYKIIKCGKLSSKKIPEPAEMHEESCEQETENDMSYSKSTTLDNLNSWLVGAINLDEDIHFSSFYLHQSTQKYLPPDLRDFGYCHITAIYDDFNETYYIPKEECEQVSQALISKILQEPMFMDNIIKKIRESIFELRDVFQIEPNGSHIFSNVPDEELIGYYKKHNEVHTKLYTYSRIPEALDRGVSTFTNYLKNYLRNKSNALQDEKKLNEVFDILTYPENISMSGIEILELYKLIQEVKAEHSVDYNRLLIRMDDSMKYKVEEYATKWAFWGYHGYRHRVIRDFNYFVERLKVELNNPTTLDEQRKKIENAMNLGATKRIITFSEYNVDGIHQVLFRYFSEIGTLKILRRYYQLRNFYYLDNLISEIAKRHNVSEAIIRCLLPNEVMELFQGKKNVLIRGKERADSPVFAYIINNDTEEFVLGTQANNLYEKMKNETKIGTLKGGIIYGDAASLGRYRGTCRIITKNSNMLFNKGDIFVGVDIDPDMLDKLKIAGAVLTESGGLTCHAAIICRELRIPCIVRANGLLDYVKDGDVLDVDADNGMVSISTSIPENIFKSANAQQNQKNEEILGHKATSLFKMKAAGIPVPEFFCVPYDVCRKIRDIIDSDDRGQESQSVIIEIKDAIKELHSPLCALRSSTLNEDLEDFSGAGQERTMLRIAQEEVVNALMIMAEEDESETKNGCIIVQEMILGDISGVLFTSNPLNSNDELLIEAIPGGNEYLTSGKISPATYIWTERNQQFEERNVEIWGGLLNTTWLHYLQDMAERLKVLFGRHQDVEWTILKDQLYILQSRNITGKTQVDRALILSKSDKRSRNILSIYGIYALPIGLQLHMLRVAAVALWILDRWTGPQLDVKSITETLLLHDIGNIVKASEDKFEALFPDTYPMGSFQYWINIRKSIIQRYGNTDTEATMNMVRELNIDKKILYMIEEKQFVNNIKTRSSDDYAIKICAYADQRVSPNGVLPIKNRLDEAIVRYRGVKNASVNSENREELIECALVIEQQIFQHVDGSPQDITDATIEPYIDELKKFRFE